MFHSFVELVFVLYLILKLPMNMYSVVMEIILLVFLMIPVNSWLLEVGLNHPFKRYSHSSFIVFIYNYAMEDYGTVKVETILDIMKVMSFAMEQGKVRRVLIGDFPIDRREFF